MSKIKKLDLLIALYIFCILVSELMGGKTFYLFNIGTYQLNTTVSIFILPFVYIIDDIVTEVFGKPRAKSIVWSGLIMVALLVIYSILAVYLPASHRFAPMESAYDSIFGIEIRISVASLLAFAIAEFSDIFIFAKLKARLGSGKLWLRNNVSNFIALFLDTAVFMVLAFWAFNQSFASNYSFIAGITIPLWLLKCAMSVFGTPITYLGVSWLRKNNEDHIA